MSKTKKDKENILQEEAPLKEKTSEEEDCIELEDSMKEAMDKLEEELKIQKDIFMRTAAEYDNFRKRTEREKFLIYNDATAVAVEKILPIADSLEFALKASENAEEEYLKGLKLIKDQFDKAFESLGVETVGKSGDEFDPTLHNAILHIEDENEKESTVVEVLQKGYKLGDRVIRHAMVKVAN